MPLYEYYCSDCNTKFDALRPMAKADDPIPCPNCESLHTARAISLFAAFSSGAAVAGTGGGCATCGTHACSTCGSR
ncbi:MAG: FmdB family transcriptional regulator [Chloroflexota bacterium]